MTATEIKVCETCSRLFLRPLQAEVFSSTCGHMIEVPLSPVCPACTLHPPKEEDLPVYTHSYRLVGGVRF